MPGPAYWINLIVCSMHGYSAEYAEMATYFGVFCVILDVFRTSAGEVPRTSDSSLAQCPWNAFLEWSLRWEFIPAAWWRLGERCAAGPWASTPWLIRGDHLAHSDVVVSPHFQVVCKWVLLLNHDVSNSLQGCRLESRRALERTDGRERPDSAWMRPVAVGLRDPHFFLVFSPCPKWIWKIRRR